MANYCRNDIFLSATESEWNEIDSAFSHHRIDWDPTTEGVERYSRDKKLHFYTKHGPVSTYSGCLPDLSRLFPTVIFFYENETEGVYKVYSDWICNGIRGHKAKSIKAMENACNVEVKRAFESRNDAAEGIRHRVEIMPDGRVAADGENRFGECNIFSWNSIVQVSCGNWHTVGLKNDGTIVSCGSNANGQCDVSDYQKKAIAVSCGRYHTAVLFSDGHVKVAGRLEQKIAIRSSDEEDPMPRDMFPLDFKQTDVSEWENVVKIHSVFDAVIGITSEGTMLIDGYCPCDKSMLCELMGLSE